MTPKPKTRLSLEIEGYLRERRAALLAEIDEIDTFLDDYNVTIPGISITAICEPATPPPIPLRPKRKPIPLRPKHA
jgi:hypothetical protein